MSEVEDEIRRQMLAERQAGAAQAAGGGGAPHPPGPSPYHTTPPPPKEGTLRRWENRGGALGALAGLLLVIAKFAAPALALLGKLKFLAFLPKFLVTGGSMFLSMLLEAQLFGWPLAVGIVLAIFGHECGHAVAAKMRGIPVTGMVFIPFMGAAVLIRRAKNVVEDAFIGIMGPVFGTLAGLICVALYSLDHRPFWFVLARWVFIMNLFNLLPMAPLDGGWIVPVFSAKLLAAGVVLLFVVAPSNPFIWLLALLSIPRIIAGWKAKPGDAYHQSTTAEKIRYGLAYAGLAAFLALFSSLLHDVLAHALPQRIA